MLHFGVFVGSLIGCSVDWFVVWFGLIWFDWFGLVGLIDLVWLVDRLVDF